ncbi:MAG: hypothetical protein EG826_11720 [Deltaproteobacteria bacterium]|nr:hypothetical protein [Deltaproteobacteria bacterium]
MKRLFCVSFALLAGVVFFSQTVFAAEPDATALKRFKPSISMGYAYFGATDLVFRGENFASLGGVNKTAVNLPGKSGSYLAGDFSFSFTDRLNLTIGGRFANAWTRQDSREEYNGTPTIGRNWESDGQFWATAEVMLAYAFVRNVSFIKNISGVVGLRGDFQHAKFKNPTLATSVISDISDENKFDMSTVSPVIGVTSTFQGFRSGIFGGDIKIGVSASPITSGWIKYKEIFSVGSSLEVDDNFYRAAMISASAEVTVITANLGPRANLLVCAYGQYTRHFIDSTVEMTGTGLANGEANFTFSMQPSTAIVGVKAAVEF